MPNGKQAGARNLAVFNGWVAAKTDDDFRQMAHRGILSRVDIARECGFAKSALDQNPDIKKALSALEDELRARNVLPPRVPRKSDSEEVPLREPGQQLAARDAETLRRLQIENANQAARIVELTRRLAKYEALHEALVSTGRVPR